MPGSLASRIKVWSATEDVVYSDLNAEFDNVLAAMQPLLMDDYSVNVSQMRVMTDAGEVGSESLATTLGGELARLRFEIKEIKGGEVDQWYEAASTSLSDLRQLVGGETLSTRVSSGRTTGFSSQLAAIVPDGSNDGLKIDGTPTNFIYYIGDTQYSITNDTVIIDGLVKAASTNNTCLVDDTNASAGEETKWLGMYNTVINVDNMGVNISALAGKTVGFKIVHSGTTEYFTAVVDSATRLSHARRGGFIDSAMNPVNVTAFSNNDTITLLKLTWIFATSTQTILVTYNEPVYSPIEPSSPSTGDFWFDMDDQIWKRFDGTIFAESSVALVGISMQDATNCVAARSIDSYVNQQELNSIDLERISNTEVKVKNFGAQISVYGTQLRFEQWRPSWNITTDLESGVTEGASTTYFLYLKETGAPVISNLPPHDHRGDRRGWYHPNEAWRYVGKIFNDGSSNLTAASLVVASRSKEIKFFSHDMAEVGSAKFVHGSTIEPGWMAEEGASISRFLYNELYEGSVNAIGTSCGTVDVYTFNAPNSKGKFLRGWDHAAGVDPDAASRTAMATGGATGDNLGSVQVEDFKAHTHTQATGNPGNGVAGSGAPTGANASIATGSAGGNETRPKNINVLYVVKALN